ncbi:hypothetical protein GCM10025880_29290 [Methylorubrum aminovorans]|nr:hypothetical protein GCM10025880_29290 [Methylorubrum aminovorans]
MGMGVLGLDRGADGGQIGLVQEVVADLDRRSMVAQADAGARTTRTASEASSRWSVSTSSSAPNIAQVMLSQTRTVRRGMFASPSFTTSKCA